MTTVDQSQRCVDADPVGRRERKKRQTRQALIDVSQRQFATTGYESTSLQDICDEVDVSRQTLLRYFPSKAELAMAIENDIFAEFRDVISDPARRQPAVLVWRDHIDRLTRRDGKLVALRKQWKRSEPVLVAMQAKLDNSYQDILAPEIARDVGTAITKDRTPLLVAAFLVAGNAAVFRHWHTEGASARRFRSDLLQVVDVALRHFPESMHSNNLQKEPT